MPNDAKRDLYEWTDLTIKAITLFCGLIVAFQGVHAYQRDVSEKVIDQRIGALNKAIDAAGKVVTAKNWDAYEQAVDEFGVVKHGVILATIGNGRVYEAMRVFYNKAVAIWNDTPYSEDIPTDRLQKNLEDMSRQFTAVINSPIDS